MEKPFAEVFPKNIMSIKQKFYRSFQTQTHPIVKCEEVIVRK